MAQERPVTCIRCGKKYHRFQAWMHDNCKPPRPEIRRIKKYLPKRATQDSKPKAANRLAKVIDR